MKKETDIERAIRGAKANLEISRGQAAPIGKAFDEGYLSGLKAGIKLGNKAH